MSHGVYFAHVVSGERFGYPLRWCLVVRNERAVVPHAPVAWLTVEHSFAFRCIFDVTGRHVEVAPVHTPKFRFGWVPRMMWIRETHPAEPVGVGRQRRQPVDGLISNPLGVIQLALDVVVLHLRGISFATTSSVHLELLVKHLKKHCRCGWVLFTQPAGIVKWPGATVCGE